MSGSPIGKDYEELNGVLPLLNIVPFTASIGIHRARTQHLKRQQSDPWTTVGLGINFPSLRDLPLSDLIKEKIYSQEEIAGAVTALDKALAYIWNPERPGGYLAALRKVYHTFENLPAGGENAKSYWDALNAVPGYTAPRPRSSEDGATGWKTKGDTP